MAASALVQEVIYARRLLQNLGFPQPAPTYIYEDNRTCIAWSEGSVGGSDRAKHNVADLLTEPLPKAAFQTLRKRLLGF